MLLEEAKKEDAENHYQAALDIYTDALERLLIAYYGLSLFSIYYYYILNIIIVVKFFIFYVFI